MVKKRIAVMIVILLIFSMLPGSALGAGISLDLSKNSATVGESITASGNTGPGEWVGIKVVDSSGSIVVFDLIKSNSNGDYSYSFKIPQISPGNLTVVAGCGSNVDNKTLQVSGGTIPGGPGEKPLDVIPLPGLGDYFDYDEVTRSQVISSRGGIIKIEDIMLIFPANAISEDIKVTIKKMRKERIPSVSSKFKLLGTAYEITTDKKDLAFKKPVTITLQFDPDEVDKEKYDVGIYSCGSDERWEILDQVQANPETGKVNGSANHFSIFAAFRSEKGEIPIVEEQPLQDVLTPIKPELNDIAGHWAEQFITELVTIGAVSGYWDGTFKPDNSITRAEFATMLVKGFKLEPKGGKVFSDTTGHWAQDNIKIAAAYGIVNGYNETSFGPDDLITREQMAVMICKAANLSGGGDKTFADNGQIADWAKVAIAVASGKNIINGYPDNNFRPQAHATRAEAVTVIVKALAQIHAD